jgi:diacylglycerol kinase (ATP)
MAMISSLLLLVLSGADPRVAPQVSQRAKAASSFLASLGFAWTGLVESVVHQRNMRVHVLAGVLVGQVGCGLRLGVGEQAALLVCVALVLFAELLNTALEQLVDLVTQVEDERARRAKDAAAAAVLVLSVGTVGVLGVILVANASLVVESVADVERQVAVGLPLTLAVGALMHASVRPRWVDWAVVALGAALWVWSLTWSRSLVFSGLTAALLALGWAAARARART